MPGSTRSLAELLLGFAAIMAVLWLPTHLQLIFGPIALLAPLLLVLLRRPCLNDLGLGWRGFASSLWIFPAAVLLSVASVQLARNVGTFHRLYAPVSPTSLDTSFGPCISNSFCRIISFPGLPHFYQATRQSLPQPFSSQSRIFPTFHSCWQPWSGEQCRASCSAVTGIFISSA